MTGPLQGIRILENANNISGPYAGMLLADLGAEVIKVEMPGTGDPFRRWSVGAGDILPQFAAFNRGKKSVTLNLKKPSAQALYLDLAAGCDLVFENFRPGTLDRLGIGYHAVSARNPKILYCSVSGMGSTGPLSSLPTYDGIAQAMSGLWSQLSDLSDPQPIGPALSDQLTGLFAAYGMLGAIAGRERTGEGQQLELSMLTASMAFLTHPVVEYEMTGLESGPYTRPRRSQTYSFVGSDDLPFAIHLSSPQKFWVAVAEAAGRADLIDDPRFATKPDRIQNYDELHEVLSKSFATRPRAEWLAALEAADVPAAPIHTIAEAINDPQALSQKAIETFGTGDRALRMTGFPVRYAKTPSIPDLPPPLLGEHTDAVLDGLGIDPTTMITLREEGAI